MNEHIVASLAGAAAGLLFFLVIVTPMPMLYFASGFVIGWIGNVVYRTIIKTEEESQ